VFLMRIISWNIRGLGGLAKRKEVRRLVGEKNPVIVCLQETTLTVCDDFLCASLWGNSPHAFSFRPSVGASGGPSDNLGHYGGGGGGVVVCKPGPCSLVSWPVSFLGRGILRGKCLWPM
jgi:hypothetical protein